MKKILVAAVVAFSSLAANAQIWMGGSLGFDYTDNDNSKAVTTFTISPEVGYTLDEKWDLGLAINANFKSVFKKSGKYVYETKNGMYDIPELPGIGHEMSEWAIENATRVVIE